MEHSPELTVSRFQRTYENALLWAAIALLGFHMLHCPYRELVKDYSIFMNIERWFGLLLAAAAITYLILSATTFHTLPRTKAYLRRFRSFEQYFLIFYFFWYILTVILRQHFFGQYHNPGFYFSDNDWWMFITGLIAFIMFPLARAIGNEKMEMLVPAMLKIILIPNMIFHAWTLWQYIHLNMVVFPSGTRLEIFEGVSMAIGANRNTTGAYSLTMLVLCLYLVMTQKAWRKLPYIIGIAVYFMVMILSNCRTSWYACLVTAIAIGFLWGWFQLKGKATGHRVVAGLLLSGLCVAFLFWARNQTFQMADAAMAKTSAIATAAHTKYQMPSPTLLSAHHTQANLTPLATGRTYETGLSQREPLYRASFYIMFHSIYCFLLGVTPSDVGTTLYGICDVKILEPHAHNFFLQMGVSYGFPFMLLTILFTVSLAVRGVRILFRYGDKLSPGAWMILVICLCMLCQDMMEAFLNSGGTMVTVSFYLFAGWIVALDKELKHSGTS